MLAPEIVWPSLDDVYRKLQVTPIFGPMRCAVRIVAKECVRCLTVIGR